MREGHNIVWRQQRIPQLNRGRREHHVVPCISLTPSSTAREISYYAAKARESINSVQEPHSKIVNQPVRSQTTQSSIALSDGVCEIEKFAVNPILVMSEYSTRLQKNHQSLRGRTPCLHSSINKFLSEPSPLQSLVTQTQQRHSMSESDEARFQHSHKGTRPYYESGSSPFPGKLTTPLENSRQLLRIAIAPLGAKTVLDDFPRGCHQNVFEAQQATALKLAPYPKKAIIIFILFNCCQWCFYFGYEILDQIKEISFT